MKSQPENINQVAEHIAVSLEQNDFIDSVEIDSQENSENFGDNNSVDNSLENSSVNSEISQLSVNNIGLESKLRRWGFVGERMV